MTLQQPPFLANLDELRLVDRARSGETTDLIEYLYTVCLPRRAQGLVNGFRNAYGARLDYEDVLQVGAEWMLRTVDTALSKRNPVTWLLKIVTVQMLRYCGENRSAIRVPYSMYYLGRRAPALVSLDTPIWSGAEFTWLDVLAAQSTTGVQYE